MTNAEHRARTPARRRVWRATRALRPAADVAISHSQRMRSGSESSGGEGGAAAETGPMDENTRPSLLAKFRASFRRLDAGDTDTESMDCDDDGNLAACGLSGGLDEPMRSTDDLFWEATDKTHAAITPLSLVRALPAETLAIALAHLDGLSLLRCAATCRALRALSFDRSVWRRLCLQKWPTLRSPVLPQLPGAPDYDVIRLYGGSWRACFTEQHRRDQRAEISVTIPQFAAADMLGVDKIVSPTFAIGSHRFCLWVFPNGNPNEPQYAGSVLSVYLVLTDLDQRLPDWLTCAVFSLSVANHLDPSARIEWHSCLSDNKFDRHLNNWGVHALGSLSVLKDPARGFLSQRGALSISASVRLMSITFRVVREADLRHHHGLGLVDLAAVQALVLPFCASLNDLLAALHEQLGVDPTRARVWCLNQPVVSGQALRPRKLLTAAHVDRQAPMFGHLLSDGVDIDAYSFCHIYLEDDDPPLNAIEELLPASSLADTEADAGGFVFVKVLDPRTRRLEYLGRVLFSSAMELTPALLYEAAARRCTCSPVDLVMLKEEIAPMVLSDPIPFSCEPIAELKRADIVVFVARALLEESVAVVHALLDEHYAVADELVGDVARGEDPVVPFRPPPTLADVEELAEKLDIPKFRVRSAFRKCREDARATLRYMMDGRHLGFICDSCGETDFRGARFNCAECSDYDLCADCYAHRDDVRHRYANVDGKWQRVFDCQEHKAAHAMREMLPVFFQRRGDRRTARLSPAIIR